MEKTMLRYLLLVAFSLTAFQLGGGSCLAIQVNSKVQHQTKVDFETQIAPLLSAYCFDCHDSDSMESGLSLDSKSGLLTGGDSGEPGVVVGDSEKSHLIHLVRGLDPELKMPPDDELSDEEIMLLSRWIDEGVTWPGPAGVVESQQVTSTHWSFQPKAEISPPQLDSDWIQNPIDAYVLKRLHAAGLEPTEKSDPISLARRLYLDVTGLPPTIEQLAELQKQLELKQADRGLSNPIDRLADSLLSSSHYGERWARYWLDLARFAETHGFETNRERPNAWRYRDYVIQSLNQDKPYDDFIKEQIAGDHFGNPIALGFLVGGPHDLVKSPDVNLTATQRQNELDDMLSTTSTTFLGITIGCARCHNHKFDPFLQKDYYAMQAMFAGVNHGELSLPQTAEQQEAAVRLQNRLKEVENQLADYLRPAVSPIENVETISPTLVESIRFSIFGTNSAEPCIDELEVFSKGTNFALETAGAKVTSSSNLPGYAIHQLEHLIDGEYGNSQSWISNEPGGGWVQLDFAEPIVVDTVKWSRDRTGTYSDRLTTDYRIEGTIDGNNWFELVSSDDRFPHSSQDIPGLLNERVKRQAESEQEHAIALSEELTQIKQTQSTLLPNQKAYSGHYSEPGPTYRLYRGEISAKREQVAADIPTLFGDLKLDFATPEAERRKELAEWIASKDNPLTARVIVNRIWQYHFGEGLVATPNDFGVGGSTPTHPELLDWLANQLVTHNWSMKHIHRLILQSATYQQSSRPNELALRKDASCRLLWRFPPRRLEAEAIRDSIVSVSGLLDLRHGGPGFSAFEVEAENVRHYHPKTSFGPEDWRRMIYMTKVRMEQDAIFGIFDCPDAATSVASRARSTTPLQALNLFNSRFVLQQASKFAERLRTAHPDEVEAQVQLAYQLCYSRSASSDEIEAASDFIVEHELDSFCRALLNSNEFLFLQ